MVGGVIPRMAVVIGIIDIGELGWEKENAALWAERHKGAHVKIAEAFPLCAFVLGADEERGIGSGFGENVAIGGYSDEDGVGTKPRGFAVDGFPQLLRHETTEAAETKG